jgi:hypothetical protein
MLETDLRADFSSRLFSEYYNTTEKCIGFAYAFLGDGEASIDVIAIHENKSESHILTKRTADSEQRAVWEYVWAELPAGINMLMIETRRGGQGISGLALDDVHSMDCRYFGDSCQKMKRMVKRM